MRKLNIIDKFIFIINSVLATLLLLSYLLPYIPPKHFALLSVLSLMVPLLMLINGLFVLYWLLKLKKQLLLSALVLVIGYFNLGSFYKFSSERASEKNENETTISVMSYNVRLFNIYKWIEDKDVEQEISSLVQEASPDILCIQEFHPEQKRVDFSQYKHNYVQLAGEHKLFGQAIFSRFPIVNSGSITFPNTPNNAIYADVVKGEDTIRVYNFHLQSLRINTQVEELKKQDSERLLKSIGNSFSIQQEQAELLLEHITACKYKMLITGDLNNTASSYVYRKIKGDLTDTFKVAGEGFGKTYEFKFYPVRIDFIFSDEAFAVRDFKTFNVLYSDHYPVMASLSLH
ncbi:endonuclease/exonuclease/phosphatase family protein [Formosa sp. S-31]|uniref:endonuclease/exonuclease/phosphatase family protein n=1 Tax=Formosa sp. S-31 TaxID=2790949 RepID=UPI003EB89935